jgi:hypothetical protein
LRTAAAVSGMCVLNNWWKAHLGLYLGVVAFPLVASHAFVALTARTSKDVKRPFEYFGRPKTAMFIAEIDGKVVGTVGIKVASLKMRGPVSLIPVFLIEMSHFCSFFSHFSLFPA